MPNPYRYYFVTFICDDHKAGVYACGSLWFISIGQPSRIQLQQMAAQAGRDHAKDSRITQAFDATSVTILYMERFKGEHEYRSFVSNLHSAHIHEGGSMVAVSQHFGGPFPLLGRTGG